MALNYQELTKCVEIEYDKLLKVDVSSDQQSSEMDTTAPESTTLMPQATIISHPPQSVIIQINTDKKLPSARIRFPIAVTIISLLQILFYVYDSMNRKNGNFSKPAAMILYSSKRPTDIWRYITYMFVHQDKFHLGPNIFFQLLGGITLEITHGWWRVTIVYLVGVLGGSLGVEALSECHALVGGSAGVYSLLGAHFSTLILNWNETQDRIIRIFILLVYVLTEIFNWMCIPQIIDNPEFGSATCALVSELTNTTINHVSGFVVGILIAIVILKNFYVRSWERKTQVISILLLVFIISLAICMIIFLPKFNIRNLTINCDKSLKPRIVKDAVVKCQKLVN